MAWIHNALILPLLSPERHRGLMRRIRQLERFDALPREEQLAVQERKVKAILEHAYRTSPYYKRTFDKHSFSASEWVMGQPMRFPILTRDILRERAEELRSTAYSEDMVRTATTGGTTSTPVRIWRDLEALRQKTAMQYHLNRLGGYDQGMRVLNIWGAERDLTKSPGWKWRLYENVLMRRCNAGAGQLSEEVLATFAEKLNRHRPRIVFGYAATIGLLADYLAAQGKPFHKPERVIVTAEPITAETREKMEQIFECPVTEHYGSRDIGMVAAQCDEGHRLHFHPAACYTEFEYAGDSEEGPMYKLIATDLLNRALPMIRYDTNDCVLMDEGPCPCGSWYPSVKKILGRALDNFVLPDGRFVTGIAVTAVVISVQGAFSHVQQMQLIQKGVQHLHLRYAAVGDAEQIQGELIKFRTEVDKLFHMPMRWTMERVSEIKRERSGKFRFCISEVSAPAQPVAV